MSEIAEGVKCKDCDGLGGNPGIACGPGYSRVGMMKCGTCSGTGRDTRNQAWVEIGSKMRDYRVHKIGDSQKEVAARRGMPVTMLNDMERGRIEPKPETITLKCLECDCAREYPVWSEEAQGVFNTFCPNGECEDRYAARQ